MNTGTWTLRHRDSSDKKVGLRNTRALLLGLLLVLGALSGVGCTEDPVRILVARCADDTGCGDGVCIQGECVDRDAVSCSQVENGRAILAPNPPLIDFGFTGSGTEIAALKMRNIGDCSLTIFEAYFENEEQSTFECPLCMPAQFPMELFPFREQELRVLFTPAEVGRFEETLVLVSDDAEFSEIRIPVRARFEGFPAPVVTPQIMDFGYTPKGRSSEATITISNHGTGTAPLIIDEIAIESDSPDAFEIIADHALPVEIPPLNQLQGVVQTFSVRYAPNDVANHAGELILKVNTPDEVLRIPMFGSSQTPAAIEVSPERVEFGEVALGGTYALPLTIINNGGTPLNVDYNFVENSQSLSTDFWVEPTGIPAIPPGAFTEIQVFVLPSTAGDLSSIITFQTNDPARPAVTVPVSAEAQEGAGAQVVKIEMTYEFGGNNFVEDDFRNVNLNLENPIGDECNKAEPEPANWGVYGEPKWKAYPPKDTPEIIFLRNVQQDDTWRINLNYVEDCSSALNGGFLGALGFGLDTLLNLLTDGLIDLEAQELASALEDACTRRRASDIALTVRVNGNIIGEINQRLERKGDFKYAADLIREDGDFRVEAR